MQEMQVRSLGRSPGEGIGNWIQSSCLGNPVDRGTQQDTVHRLTKELDVTEQLNKNHLKLTGLKAQVSSRERESTSCLHRCSALGWLGWGCVLQHGLIPNDGVPNGQLGVQGWVGLSHSGPSPSGFTQALHVVVEEFPPGRRQALRHWHFSSLCVASYLLFFHGPEQVSGPGLGWVWKGSHQGGRYRGGELWNHLSHNLTQY